MNNINKLYNSLIRQDLPIQISVVKIKEVTEQCDIGFTYYSLLKFI